MSWSRYAYNDLQPSNIIVKAGEFGGIVDWEVIWCFGDRVAEVHCRLRNPGKSAYEICQRKCWMI